MRTLLSIASAYVALHSVGCVGGASILELVLPKGFSGEIRIVLDPNGERIASQGGRTTYRIPKSGVVRVQSLSPFEEWHSLIGTFEDKENVPVGVSPSEASLIDGGSQTFLWSGGVKVTDSVTEVRYFVGTVEEYEEWAYRD